MDANILLDDYLTINELEGLADMMIAYGDLSDKIENLKKELLNLCIEKNNLSFPIERNGVLINEFIPNEVIWKRLLNRIDLMPLNYQKLLKKMSLKFIEQ